jgi:pyruvate/2-oxoglutarate dehydrogenase complex dihydrolipoamide acyltransferase (E2) component
MSAPARRAASPYARRLAREQGFGLELISGSGPNGRIVAADVEAFANSRAARHAERPAAAAAAVSAYACALNLGKLQQLLADFGGAELSLSLDAMLVRAAALALEAVPGANQANAIAVAWETGGTGARSQLVLVAPHLGLVSRLSATLADAAAATAPETRAGVSLRRIAHTGIRPTSMPLLPGTAMRLMVAAGADAAAEALLCFDAATVGEDDAAAFLARFRDGLEIPLRLLA